MITGSEKELSLCGVSAETLKCTEGNSTGNKLSRSQDNSASQQPALVTAMPIIQQSTFFSQPPVP